VTHALRIIVAILVELVLLVAWLLGWHRFGGGR